MRIFLAIVLALVLGPYITSTSARAEAAITGVGVSSCADFGKMYQANPDEAEMVFFTWAQGFMSGYNATFLASGQPGRNLAAETFRDEKIHIRRYCDQHPLLTYMRAVFDLYLSLPPGAPLSRSHSR